MAKQAAYGQGTIDRQSLMLAPDSLGLTGLNSGPGPITEAASIESETAEAGIHAMPLLDDGERQQRLSAATHAWLELVDAGNYQQAHQNYRNTYAEALTPSIDSDHLLSLVDYFLVHQSYAEAHGLIQAAGKLPGLRDEPRTSARLKLMALVADCITGSQTLPVSAASISSLWNAAQRCSRQFRSLLLDCFMTHAIHEMQLGHRKTAAQILDAVAAKEQHQDPSHDSQIDILRQVCDHGTWESVRGRIAKKTRRSANVSYARKYACAIDSMAVYNNGQIIVVYGWHISDPSDSLLITLEKNRCLLTAQPSLVKRVHRGDLADIAQRYGFDPQGLFGFVCTLIPDAEALNDLDWSDDGRCNAILCTDSSTAVLEARCSFKELMLTDIRDIVRQIVGDDLSLKDYNTAQRIKRIWSEQIAERCLEESEHYIFGEQDKNPDVSLLIPLYGRIDFMELQLHWFFTQTRSHGSFQYRYQLIYCLDDPGLKDTLLRLAHKCSMIYKIPFEIVVNSKNLGYAASNNEAAKYATAETLLLLNSDVMPRDQQAIDTLIKAYRGMPANKGALGAKLLYPSNDIQHVGMCFYKDSSLPGILSSCWLNEHPHKHIKHTSNPSLQTGIIETEAATAACLLIDKAIFTELGGFRLDFISGDFEDSDLCLRLRQRGHSIMVCLDAVFFHLERQSMVLQAGHGQEALKLVAFNAYTHNELHSATIEDMKSRLATTASSPI